MRYTLAAFLLLCASITQAEVKVLTSIKPIQLMKSKVSTVQLSCCCRRARRPIASACVRPIANAWPKLIYFTGLVQT